MRTSSWPVSTLLLRAAPLIVAVLANAGCHNACQRLCVRMKDYAEECGQTVSDAELTECLDARADEGENNVCRDFGSADILRNEWTCDDIAIYWGG